MDIKLSLKWSLLGKGPGVQCRQQGSGGGVGDVGGRGSMPVQMSFCAPHPTKKHQNIHCYYSKNVLINDLNY